MPLDEKRKSLSSKEKKMIDNIKHLRQEANITQEELSYLIGKNSNYMGMIESYRRGISFKTLFKIAVALKTEAYQFLKNI